MGELFQAPRVPYIDATDIKWHDIDSCVVNLITDSTAQIHRICRFSARKATIKPTWLQLSRFDYVLSNLTDIESVCDGGHVVPWSTQVCMPCLIRMACNCRLRHRLEWDRPKRTIAPMPRCNSNSITASILHPVNPVNLALLHNFYDTTNVSITGRDLFNASELGVPKPLNWPMFAERH